jgi:hypothetical protein
MLRQPDNKAMVRAAGSPSLGHMGHHVIDVGRRHSIFNSHRKMYGGAVRCNHGPAHMFAGAGRLCTATQVLTTWHSLGGLIRILVVEAC